MHFIGFGLNDGVVIAGRRTATTETDSHRVLIMVLIIIVKPLRETPPQTHESGQQQCCTGSTVCRVKIGPRMIDMIDRSAIHTSRTLVDRG